MSVRAATPKAGATFGGESKTTERMSFGAHEVRERDTPVEVPSNWPAFTVALDGSLSVKSAPDDAEFSLYFLTTDQFDDRNIERKGNTVTFNVTNGDPIVYKITGYDFDVKRFTGTRVYE